MMISLIAHAGAVPFGYTSEMDDCEVQCFSYDDHNITDCETMSWVNTRASTTGKLVSNSYLGESYVYLFKL